MKMNKQIKDLVAKLTKADIHYYGTGYAQLPDAEYDMLRKELERMDPDNNYFSRVGVAPLQSKVNHHTPMGSLKDSMSFEELSKWEALLKLTTPIYHASLKLDGCSLSLIYQDGILVRGVTRGDGYEGADVTVNVMSIPNIPKTITYSGTIEIRGEVVLPVKNWLLVDPDQTSNPRNVGTGMLWSKGGQHDLLEFYAFTALTGDSLDTLLCNGMSMADTYFELSQLRFSTPPYEVGDLAHVHLCYSKWQEDRDSMPYWIDGVVVLINYHDTRVNLGDTNRRPKGGRAFKFPPPGEPTTINSIILTVGRTGAIIPNAELAPVRIKGTTVTRASLSNWDQVELLDVAEGDSVLVSKRGDIIPHVEQVLERPKSRRKVARPKVCPCKLQSPLESRETLTGDSTAIYCTGTNCPERLKFSILYWLQKNKILGLGDAYVEDLTTRGILTSVLVLYKMQPIDFAVVTGVAVSRKIYAAVQASKENMTMDYFIGSLGIQGMGISRVRQLIKADPAYNKLTPWFNTPTEEFSKSVGMPNILPTAVKEIRSRNLDILPLYAFLMPKPYEPDKADPDIVLCITGTLPMKKKFYEDRAKELGWGCASSLTKSVTVLAAADPTGSSIKLQKARKAGVDVISGEELCKRLGIKQ